MSMINVNALSTAGQLSSTASGNLQAALAGDAKPEQIQLLALQAKEADVAFSTVLRNENSRLSTLEQVATAVTQ